MASSLKLEVRRPCTAPRRVVFDTLHDVAGWSAWAPGVVSSRLDSAADDAAEHCGIRALSFPMGFVVREQIVEVFPQRGQSYGLLGWAPFTDYRGTVTIEDEAGGCAVVWGAEFRPRLRGTGLPLRGMLRWTIQQLADGLVAEAGRRWDDDAHGENR